MSDVYGIWDSFLKSRAVGHAWLRWHKSRGFLFGRDAGSVWQVTLIAIKEKKTENQVSGNPARSDIFTSPHSPRLLRTEIKECQICCVRYDLIESSTRLMRNLEICHHEGWPHYHVSVVFLPPPPSVGEERQEVYWNSWYKLLFYAAVPRDGVNQGKNFNWRHGATWKAGKHSCRSTWRY